MFLNKEILDKYHACGEGREWFEKNFPDGAELIDVINRRHVPIHILHWGFENFSSTQEEKNAYYAAIHVTNCPRPHSIYKSDHVTASDVVSGSSNIKNSKCVSKSSFVENSELIKYSDTVESSNIVSLSSFVFNSERVVDSKNVNDSSVIYASEFIINSRFVRNASNVENSYCISAIAPGGVRNIRDSAFISNCTNLTNCLFCSEIGDQENCLFNKPVSPEIIKQTKRQMELLLTDWEPIIIDEEGGVDTNIRVMYRYLPERFYRWVKTLPGYDPIVLYSITFKDELLFE